MSSLRPKNADSAQPRKPGASGKKPVATPTTLGHFMVILVMHLCRKALLVDPAIKLGVYTIALVLVSMFADFRDVPKSYFANKNNIFNQYFVKLGWGWTLALMLPFIYLTSYTYCCGRKAMVKRHLLRLAVGTMWWFVCTKTFNIIENMTGVCASGDKEHYDRRECKKAGYEWLGFDISGHTFLLIHCLLLMAEEVKCISGWDKIADIIKSEEETPSNRISPSELQTLKTSYQDNTPVIKCFTVLIAVLQILWEVMLVATFLYFHNMPQKLIGATFAAVTWRLSYYVWYRTDLPSPLLPGEGPFRYMKAK